jgi:hypothetical protein
MAFEAEHFDHHHMASSLATLFAAIEANETNYIIRESLVYNALSVAKMLSYPCGIRVDPNELDWPVVCIRLPDGIGEVSWHCPAYKTPYTGYDTTEKYARTRAYIAKYDKKAGPM